LIEDFAKGNLMSSSVDSAAFDKGTDPILKFFTVDQARQIVAFRGERAIAGPD
jgi:hypothetical protein